MATRQKLCLLSVLPLCLLIIAKGTFGQNQSAKTTIANAQHEYLEFIDDTTVVMSGGGGWKYTTAYLIRADTLYLKIDYWTGPSRERHWVTWRDYKILSWRTDSIQLLNRFRGVIDKPAKWQDTLLFVVLPNFRRSILGQCQSCVGAFAGSQLEYLEFRNDTTAVTTLTGEWDTTNFMIKADTLYLEKEYWESGPGGDRHVVNWLNFRLLSWKVDTIWMLHPFKGYARPGDWEDTVRFIALANLKEPIQTFGYLRMTNQSPWTGTTTISIDSAGRLVFYRENRNNGNPNSPYTSQITRWRLSEKEMNNFKSLLSYSFLSKMHRFRGGCGAMDASRTTFEIAYNNKRIISEGCTVSWPHALLLNRLYALAESRKR